MDIKRDLKLNRCIAKNSNVLLDFCTLQSVTGVEGEKDGEGEK